MKASVSNQLMDGNIILERLAQLNLKESTADAYREDLFVSKFDQATADLRDSWMFAVVTEADQRLLENYFSHQANCLIGLLSAYTVTTIPSSRARFKSLALLASMFKQYSQYINDSLVIPSCLRQELLINSNDSALRLISVFSELEISDNLKKCVLGYVIQMSGEKEYVCSFGQLKYFQIFITELLNNTELEFTPNVEETLISKLLDLEFNHLDVFMHIRKLLLSDIACKKMSQRLIIIKQKIDFYSFKAKGLVPRLDPRWPALSALLIDCLVEENKKFNPSKDVVAQPIGVNVLKLRLQLPLAHLAFLLRLFAKAKILGSTPIKDVFRFFSSNFSTKRQDDISLGGISKEYYTKDMVTAVEVRALLTSMIKQINQDYFPVFLAVNVIIAFH